MRFHLLAVLGACVVASTAFAGGYVESWENPLLGSNGWNQYEQDFPPDGGRPLEWRTAGGQSEGYVRSDVANLTFWRQESGDVWIPGALFPAYSYGWVDSKDDITHPINLLESPLVEAWMKDDEGLGGTAPLDLRGGRIVFWVGEWDQAPGGPPLLSFYFFDEPFAARKDWTRNIIDVSSLGDWRPWIDTLHKPLNALLADPQQWGFGIYVASDENATGVLGIDSFRTAVPEPTDLAELALVAIVGLMRRR